MTSHTTPLLLLLIATTASAQTFVDGEEEIAASALTLDVAARPSAYAGRYHFGFSEGESDVTISVKGDRVTGELGYGVWVEKTGQWKRKTIKFTGTITGNMLVAGAWKGLFVRHGERRGLVMIAAPSEMVAGNFGYRYEE